MKRFLLLLVVSLVCFSGKPPVDDPDYFSPPLDIPLSLAGNFAELRNNHFHGGIDLKTRGVTGLPVYAAADGFVSRISVSPAGYGQALYLEHPNGKTTVYGHLEKFSPEIENYVRTIQYERESFAVDLTVPQGALPVKRGQQIAFSGNTGSSGGPHLHFEIRDTYANEAINPLLYNFPIADKTSPVVLSETIYPLSGDAHVGGKTKAQRYETERVDGVYRLKGNPVVPVFGKIGFAVDALDFFDGSLNKCGIYSLVLKVDDNLVYSFKIDQFPIEDTRYINSLMDYEQVVRYGRKFYKNWIEPGNRLPIYDSSENRGIWDATDEKVHTISYEVSDVAGNKTQLKFQVRSQKMNVLTPEPAGTDFFPFNQVNIIQRDDVIFELPEGTLYSDLNFNFQQRERIPGTYSDVFLLHNVYVPLQKFCRLRIKADELPERLRDKALLVTVDLASGRKSAAGGAFKDGWVDGSIRSLGNYAIGVDTIAPVITSLSIENRQILKDSSCIRFKISDNLSGVQDFRGTIDGNWVLFEFDQKTATLTYTFDPQRMVFGKKHELVLTVADSKNNISTYKATFFK